MRKADVQIGGQYRAKISNGRTSVKITAENPHGGWDAINLNTGRVCRIKTAQRLSPDPLAPPIAPKPTKTKAKAKAKATPAGEKKMTMLEAAHTLLKRRKAAMNSKEIVEALAEHDLWKPRTGKTPHATLHSAISRAIAKGDERFRKAERGRFTSD